MRTVRLVPCFRCVFSRTDTVRPPLPFKVARIAAEPRASTESIGVDHSRSDALRPPLAFSQPVSSRPQSRLSIRLRAGNICTCLPG